jgi:hypothetical protein
VERGKIRFENRRLPRTTYKLLRGAVLLGQMSPFVRCTDYRTLRQRYSETEYRLVFYYVLLKAGLVNGFNRVQSNEVSPESGDEFTAQANWATFDANWNVLIKGSGGATGTRLETPGQD